MTSKNTCMFVCATLLVSAAPAHLLKAEDTTVTTWHNDSERTGLNSRETLLTRTNVNTQSFGKTGFYATDGIVDAQPLHVPGVGINGGSHDVIYVVTEHDTVYAIDSFSGKSLWQKSVLKSGETTSDDHGCGQITPEIGITSTPVIDQAQGPHGVIYVVGMSKDASGLYHQRLNALDMTTGAQLFGGPREIAASFPGTGDNSSGGSVIFNPAQYAERAALLEWKGSIYTAWTSHCDKRPYTGWILSYNASNLDQTAVLNVTPNGSEGAVWMSGAGLAASDSRIFLLDANGSFDTTLDANGFPEHGDFGNAMLSLGPTSSGLSVLDYYATDTTVQQSAADTDFGSGGLIVLPTVLDKNGIMHFLTVGAGKDHNIYLADRENLGKYHANGGSIYQVLSGALPNGEWGAPAVYDNTIYYGGINDKLRAFSLWDAKLLTTPASLSTNTFPYPGTTPSISSNGTGDGIVWAISHAASSVLYAYNAANLADELYDSTQSDSRDAFGQASHFGTPMIANGHVYVGTTTGVAVFGLLGK